MAICMYWVCMCESECLTTSRIKYTKTNFLDIILVVIGFLYICTFFQYLCVLYIYVTYIYIYIYARTVQW